MNNTIAFPIDRRSNRTAALNYAAARFCEIGYKASMDHFRHGRLLVDFGSGEPTVMPCYTKQWDDWQFDLSNIERRFPAEGLPMVLVDYEPAVRFDRRYEPDVYVVPMKAFRDMLRAGWQDWIDQHGGERPRTPDSQHCTISPRDVRQWSVGPSSLDWAQFLCEPRRQDVA